MLVIRFQRVGRKNDPAFRIVVGERRSKPQSDGIERLGSYHPKTKEIVLKNERILYWISKGAHPSPTIHNLLVSKGVIQGNKINVVPPPKKSEAPSTPEVSEAGDAVAEKKPESEVSKEGQGEKVGVTDEKKEDKSEKKDTTTIS